MGGDVEKASRESGMLVFGGAFHSTQELHCERGISKRTAQISVLFLGSLWITLRTAQISLFLGIHRGPYISMFGSAESWKTRGKQRGAKLGEVLF